MTASSPISLSFGMKIVIIMVEMLIAVTCRLIENIYYMFVSKVMASVNWRSQMGVNHAIDAKKGKHETEHGDRLSKTRS